MNNFDNEDEVDEEVMGPTQTSRDGFLDWVGEIQQDFEDMEKDLEDNFGGW